MKGTRSLWLSLTLVLLSGLAYGSSSPGDPGIEIDDPSCTPTLTQTITAGQIDSFSTTSAGTGCFGFTIAGGSAAFNTVDIQVGAFFDLSTINCFSPNYGCQKSTLDDGTVTDLFFTALPSCIDCSATSTGTQAYGGGTMFVVDLTADQFGNWGANTFFIRGGSSTAPADNPNLIQLAAVPEPSMLLLFGIGAALTRIKLRVRPN